MEHCVVSLRRTEGEGSKMTDIMVSHNDLARQEGVAFSGSRALIPLNSVDKSMNLWCSGGSFILQVIPTIWLWLARKRPLARVVPTEGKLHLAQRRTPNLTLFLFGLSFDFSAHTAHASLDKLRCFGANLRFSLFIFSNQNTVWLRAYSFPTCRCDSASHAVD